MYSTWIFAFATDVEYGSQGSAGACLSHCVASWCGFVLRKSCIIRESAVQCDDVSEKANNF